MTWGSEMTVAAATDFLADTAALKPPAIAAMCCITARLVRLGPIPFDDQTLADVSRCGVKTWTNRVWPQLAPLFDVVDGFLRRPDIDTGPTKRSLAAQKAANARHEQERARRAQLSLISDNTAAPAGASDDAQDMRSHAIAEKSDAISTAGALRSQAQRSHDASAEAVRPASGAASAHAAGPAAPALARTPPPPSSESSSPGKKEESFGGGERLNAPAHAPRKTSAAAAQPLRSPSAPAQPIAADWQPDERSRQEAVRLGVDVEASAARFRDYCLSSGLALADFNARFRNWIRDDAKKLPPKQRGLPPMALSEPAPTAEESPLKARLDAAGARWLKERRGPPTPSWPDFRARLSKGGEVADTALRWLVLLERCQAGDGSVTSLPALPTFAGNPARWDGGDSAEAVQEQRAAAGSAA